MTAKRSGGFSSVVRVLYTYASRSTRRFRLLREPHTPAGTVEPKTCYLMAVVQGT